MPHLVMTGEPRGFSRVSIRFSSSDRECKEPLVLAQGSPISSRVVRESWGLLSSHCRANRPHVGFCPENPCSSPMATGISVLHSRFTRGFRPRLEWKQIISLSSRVAMGISLHSADTDPFTIQNNHSSSSIPDRELRSCNPRSMAKKKQNTSIFSFEYAKKPLIQLFKNYKNT